MEAVKRWLSPKKTNNKKRTRPRHHRSSSESSTESLSYYTVTELNHDVGIATTTFTPEGRGKEAILAWLDTGESEALVHLLQERDLAERQVRRGPRTKGTREVQDVLRKPSIKTLEYFHRVRRQAELTIRYGVPGAVAYNFSKSLGWNKIAASRLPPLQLRSFGAMMKEHAGLFGDSPRIPPIPSTPIDWLDLGTPGTSCHNGQFLSPISEVGGWRDTPPQKTERPASRLGFTQDDECEIEEELRLPQVDADVEREYDLHNDSPTTPNVDITEDDGVVSEAKAITVTEVSSREIRQVYLQPRRRRQVKALSTIVEASDVEAVSSDE
ncbi:hypothetical protein F4779DRAFT_352499 [Xylariaceae sp. FL0662B]|nr:hypothetical protein F4779DRAFT_352499 [Xylariaceae sp. FL0662B]